MFLCRNKLFTILLLSVSVVQVNAQTSTSGSNPRNGRDNNPYSKYGIGELLNGNNTALRGMGNITSAYLHPTQINTDNPASYSFLTRTTFELGATGESRTTTGQINGIDEKYTTGTASVAYMSFAVPVTKNGGFCIGFKPQTRVYYSLIDSVSSTSTSGTPIGETLKSYNGEGALNYAFLGGSAKYKGLSVGFNAGYLFGTTRNTTALYSIADQSSGYYNSIFNSEYSSYTRTGGINWKGGLLYEVKIDSTHKLRIGGTLSLNRKLKQNFSEFHISYHSFGDTLTRDTLYSVDDQTGKLTLPLSYSVGVMYVKDNKWGVGIDYAATQWSGFNSQLNSYMNTGIAASSYKVSVGAEFSPAGESGKHYLSHGVYRIGAYYGTDYLQLENQALTFYGVTAGASLPFKRSQSQMHFAFDYGKLGTTDFGLLKQNYLRFTIGLSMSDLWFIKRKYD